MTDRFTTGSCWVATIPERRAYSPLASDARAGVAVVGGGIVGLTTAVMLQRAGRSVVLLEAARVGRAVTGGSTAKITSQHGLIYHHLESVHGRDAAAIYARSNEAGREWITEQVNVLGIDCDFEPASAYVYAESEEQAAAIEREVEAAVRAGLPASLVRDDIGLPFPVRVAMKFDEQAQFHPVRYAAALAAELVARGGRIHEGTRVVDVDHGTPCTVVTEHGTVRADDVVIATNIPILDRGGFFGRAFPYRHMCIAAPIDASRAPSGMYISADSPTRSIRSAPWTSTERLLVLIGEAFPTAQADAGERLAALEAFAREKYLATARFSWGNQDYYAVDRIPYVGPILPGMSHIRVATGFNAWGITTGTAAAMMLADDVLGRDNDWRSLYDSRRLGLKGGARSLLGKNAAVAASWLAEKLEGAPNKPLASIRPGEASIVRVNGKPAAAYRDHDGVLHAFDARCTHMGCRLSWNSVERSWDCHCHGSRFDVTGAVLHGPAVRRLKPIAQ